MVWPLLYKRIEKVKKNEKFFSEDLWKFISWSPSQPSLFGMVSSFWDILQIHLKINLKQKNP